jgi:transposase
MRDELTETQWERLLPLLPPQKPKSGRPAKDHRTGVNAILWIARTGAGWRDLPADAGVCWKTAASCFYRWTASGAWQGVLAELQRGAAENGGVDWSRHFVDGSSVRAHQHAAGSRSGQAGEALGRSRGGFSTKFHVRAKGHGKPLAFVLSAGQRHESKLFEPLMEDSTAERTGRIASGGRSGCVVADKGYSHGRIRRYLARGGLTAVVPLRSDQGHDPSFDRETYRQRNKVERLIGRLKQWRRIATRYEKRAANYLAMLTLASVILWL